jgi:glycosyltransferase involved in cell wall biosynthesis
MRILLVTQYFTPEVTAARVRLHAFAQGLAERGHEVEVVCELPNHPEGVVQEGYRRRAVVHREFDGFRVSYVYVSASPKKTFARRLALYGSFAVSATVAGSAMRRPDVIFASSPPLPVAAAAAAIATRHRVPWVFDVRDLWPEAAVVLGELSNERAIRAAERLEHRLYRSAAAITTVTASFKARIAEHLDDDAKIHLIPNGTTRAWLAAGEAEPDRAGCGIAPDRFAWLYAGNLGIAQGLETAIDAAAELGDGFELTLLGAGPLRTELESRAAALPAGSVRFRDPVQPDVAARSMRAADALLVPLADRPELAQFVPSKLFDCAAVGRPVIVASRGEAPRIASEAEAALVVEPGDSAALAAAVRRLRDDPELRERLSEAGKRLAARYLREDQVVELDAILTEVVGTNARNGAKSESRFNSG